jgi:predicted house-cleaning noncanonical NTP pyrophosphatase (MazG superfamily)
MIHFGDENLIMYNKAIRDKIPEIIKNSGNSCNVKTLNDDDFLIELEKKLKEELEEYFENKTIEELGDIVDVINRIVILKGVSSEDFKKIRSKKISTNGGFDKNFFLLDAEKD